MKKIYDDLMDSTERVAETLNTVRSLMDVAYDFVARPKKILLCDDDTIVLVEVDRLLRPYGYEVVAVNDPTQVAVALVDGGYGLVVTDFMMPKHDGLWVLDQIKDIEIPKLMLTGMPVTKELTGKTEPLGATALSKSDLESFVEAVIACLPEE